MKTGRCICNGKMKKVGSMGNKRYIVCKECGAVRVMIVNQSNWFLSKIMKVWGKK